MSKEFRSALIAASISALIGLVGACLHVWQDVGLLKLRVENLETDAQRKSEWLRTVSKAQKYYHGASGADAEIERAEAAAEAAPLAPTP